MKTIRFMIASGHRVHECSLRILVYVPFQSLNREAGQAVALRGRGSALQPGGQFPSLLHLDTPSYTHPGSLTLLVPPSFLQNQPRLLFVVESSQTCEASKLFYSRDHTRYTPLEYQISPSVSEPVVPPRSSGALIGFLGSAHSPACGAENAVAVESWVESRVCNARRYFLREGFTPTTFTALFKAHYVTFHGLSKTIQLYQVYDKVHRTVDIR